MQLKHRYWHSLYDPCESNFIKVYILQDFISLIPNNIEVIFVEDPVNTQDSS